MMKKHIIVVAALLFLVGVGMGLWHAKTTNASVPAAGGNSATLPTLLVYDEDWQANEGYISTDNGYQKIDPSAVSSTAASGEIKDEGGDTYVSTYPDIFVTKWKVQGHLHYK
jgi:hypothetical protein